MAATSDQYRPAMGFSNEIYGNKTARTPSPLPYVHDISDSSTAHSSSTPTTFTSEIYGDAGRYDDEKKDLGTPVSTTSSQSRAAAQEEFFQYQHTVDSNPIRTLSVYNTLRQKQITIRDEGGTTIYFADVSRYSKAPDVRLHAGDSADHPAIATARFRHSSHLKLGLGDELTSPNSVMWTEMRKLSRFSYSRYRFEFDETVTVEGGGGSSSSEEKMHDFGVPPPPRTTTVRKAYLWQRTHATEDGVTGLLSKMSSYNYKLVDEASGETLAIFLTSCYKSWTKLGKLLIKSERVTGDLEVLAVLSLCGLAEQARRRCATAAAAA